jgi:hypothetical protein
VRREPPPDPIELEPRTTGDAVWGVVLVVFAVLGVLALIGMVAVAAFLPTP